MVSVSLSFSASTASVTMELASIRRFRPSAIRRSVRRSVRHLFFEKDPSTNGDGLSKKVFRERTMGVEHGVWREGGRIEENRKRGERVQKRKEGGIMNAFCVKPALHCR